MGRPRHRPVRDPPRVDRALDRAGRDEERVEQHREHEHVRRRVVLRCVRDDGECRQCSLHRRYSFQHVFVRAVRAGVRVDGLAVGPRLAARVLGLVLPELVVLGRFLCGRLQLLVVVLALVRVHVLDEVTVVVEQSQRRLRVVARDGSRAAVALLVVRPEAEREHCCLPELSRRRSGGERPPHKRRNDADRAVDVT